MYRYPFLSKKQNAIPVYVQNRRQETINRTYHVLFIGKHQNDTVQHKRIFDNGLQENRSVNWEINTQISEFSSISLQKFTT